MTLVLPQPEPALVCPSHPLVPERGPGILSEEPRWQVLYAERSRDELTPAYNCLHRFEVLRKFVGIHKFVAPDSPAAHRWDNWTAEHRSA